MYCMWRLRSGPFNKASDRALDAMDDAIMQGGERQLFACPKQTAAFMMQAMEVYRRRRLQLHASTPIASEALNERSL